MLLINVDLIPSQRLGTRLFQVLQTFFSVEVLIKSSSWFNVSIHRYINFNMRISNFPPFTGGIQQRKFPSLDGRDIREGDVMIPLLTIFSPSPYPSPIKGEGIIAIGFLEKASFYNMYLSTNILDKPLLFPLPLSGMGGI